MSKESALQTQKWGANSLFLGPLGGTTTAFCGKIRLASFWLTMRLLLQIILVFNLSSLLHAQTYDSSYSELRRPGQAVRNLGMGNTGVALSADESALYYNPAGLGGVDSLMLNLSILLEIPARVKISFEKLRNCDG